MIKATRILLESNRGVGKKRTCSKRPTQKLVFAGTAKTIIKSLNKGYSDPLLIEDAKFYGGGVFFVPTLLFKTGTCVCRLAYDGREYST